MLADNVKEAVVVGMVHNTRTIDCELHYLSVTLIFVYIRNCDRRKKCIPAFVCCACVGMCVCVCVFVCPCVFLFLCF